MGKYICEKCNWRGDEPITVHPEYEDGGWFVCPNGCIVEEADPYKYDMGKAYPVVLDEHDPRNQAQYARIMAKNNFGIPL